MKHNTFRVELIYQHNNKENTITVYLMGENKNEVHQCLSTVLVEWGVDFDIISIQRDRHSFLRGINWYGGTFSCYKCKEQLFGNLTILSNDDRDGKEDMIRDALWMIVCNNCDYIGLRILTLLGEME